MSRCRVALDHVVWDLHQLTGPQTRQHIAAGANVVTGVGIGAPGGGAAEFSAGRKALHHAELFAKTSSDKSRGLVNKLLELEKMKPVIAIRIADLMPQSRDELRAVYAKEKYTLGNEELDQILELVAEAMD